MGYDINWHSTLPQLLAHPLYQKWSVQTLGYVLTNRTTLASDMGNIIANKDSAPILSYLSWLAREAILLSSLTG